MIENKIVEVLIEISLDSDPIKYEERNGKLYVDRILGTPLKYPCNYGYIPRTLADDGDCVDAVVISPYPIIPLATIECRVIGVLNIEDQDGEDPKLIVVPNNTDIKRYQKIHEMEDITNFTTHKIQEFFTRYKAYSDTKWSKVLGWDGREQGELVLKRGQRRYMEKGRIPSSMLPL